MNKGIGVLLLLVLAVIVAYWWAYPFIGLFLPWWQGILIALYWGLVGYTVAHIAK